MRKYNEHIEKYQTWLEKGKKNENLMSHLEKMTDEDMIKEAFYSDLKFGTSGIRGIMGAGTNRINEIVISRVTKGIVNYLYRKNQKANSDQKIIVVVSYDSRLYSKEFAEYVGKIFSCNGIEVFIFEKSTAVPILSYGIRKLKADLGVMITASHNSKKYNGYKVYDNRGCQILNEEAEEIFEEIEKIRYFEEEEFLAGGKYKKIGKIQAIDETLEMQYVDDIVEYFKEMGILNEKGHLKELNENTHEGHEDLFVVYTPLNGTGKRPITYAMQKIGIENTVLVNEQLAEDGIFETCPNPNPELNQVYDLGRKELEKNGSDIVIATDPDCDRMGVFTKNRRLSGNEIAMLMLHYLCKVQKNNFPEKKKVYKSIVSTKLAEEIARSNKMDIEKTLIGFKYIGNLMDDNYKEFLMGFEEGNGYLTNSLIRDKDGISGAILISIIGSWWKNQGKTLDEGIEEIYKEYGYFQEENAGYDLEGIQGKDTIDESMRQLRKKILEYGRVLEFEKAFDYLEKKIYYKNPKDGLTNCETDDELNQFNKLPRADILEFIGENGSSVIIRPSGTEPKLKIYFSARGSSRGIARGKIDRLKAKTLDIVNELIKNI